MNLTLWLAAQRLIGGTYGKQKLALSYYKGGSVLEIGCSVGNVSEAFVGRCDDFVGQDIDEDAIQVAQRRLPTLKFTSAPISEIKRRFDYVIIAGVLHHCDNPTSLEIIRDASRLTAPGGTLMSYDSLPVAKQTTLARKIVGGMEAGQFLRPLDQLVDFYRSLGLPVQRAEVYKLPAWKAAWPEIFDLGVVVTHPTPANSMA